MFFGGAFVLGLALFLVPAAGSSPQLVSTFRTRNAPGTSEADTHRAIGRALTSAKLHGRESILEKSTTLDRSWLGATLLSLEIEKDLQGRATSSTGVGAKIEVTCSTCYIKGSVHARLTIDGDFNATKALNDYIENIKDEVANTTSATVDYFQDYVEGLGPKLGDGFDPGDLDLPPFPLDFNVDLPDIPECHIRFDFLEGLEVYVLLDMNLVLSSTYTLNLFTSPPEFGVAVGDDLLVGLVVTVDLILSAEVEIQLSTGFHLKIDEGAAIDMKLFGKEVADVTINGGKFEFLPVTVEFGGAVVKAVLRIGARAGLVLSTPDPKVFGITINLPDASAGIEAGVWAHIAEFTTNITATPGDEECELPVVETYQFVVGAAAGASVALAGKTWGPTPETSTPLFFTTLAEACASKGRPTSSLSTTTGEGKMTTTTIKTEVTYTALACNSQLIDCPASLQSRTVTSSTTTITTVVPSGVKATLAAVTKVGAPTTVAFGTGAKDLISSSGPPKSYVPVPTTVGGVGEILNAKTGGVSNKVIIGVSVGLGVPVLIAIIAGCVFFCRRRRSAQAEPFHRRSTMSSTKSGIKWKALRGGVASRLFRQRNSEYTVRSVRSMRESHQPEPFMQEPYHPSGQVHYSEGYKPQVHTQEQAWHGPDQVQSQRRES